MPICEKCSVSFSLPEGPVEVVTTRVLCPACLREYRAAKAAKVASLQKAPTQKTPTQQTPTQKAPSTNQRPAQPHAAAPPRPRTALDAEPGALPPARAVGKRPLAPSESLARPKNAQPRSTLPAKPISAKRPSEPAKLERRPARKPSRDREFIARETQALKKRESRTLWIGGITALVLMAAAGGVVWMVVGKKTAEQEAFAAAKKRVDDFYAQFQAMEMTTEEEAQALVNFAEQNQDIWRTEEIAPDVNSRMAKAKNTIDRMREVTSLLERLAKIEEVLKTPETQSAEALAEERRKLDELEAKAGMVGDEFVARVKAARATADQWYVTRLHEEAKAAAVALPGREALAKYTRAEEEILKIYEKTVKDQNKEAQGFFQQQYREVIQESDALCASVFTDAAIEATPWRDLLAGDEVSKWRAAALEGFEHRIENGVLHILGPSPQAGALGILSIGDDEFWRDFVLDFEFAILKGDFQIYLRLGPKVDGSSESVSYTTEGPDAVNVGETYPAEVSFIGSTMAVTLEENPTPYESSWTKRRKGAIGLVIPEGSEIRFTRMRIRVLR